MSGKLRIVAGKWRSRILRFDPSLGIRPTTDAARESLFNRLQHRIEGSVCLDLYAGSGALGFEALSRGASHAVLVDSDRRCIEALKKTAADLGSNQHSIVHCKAFQYLKNTQTKFDIIFVDPPFYRNLSVSSLKAIEVTECLQPDGIVYVETERNSVAADSLGEWRVTGRYQSGFLNCRLFEQRK